MSIEAATLLGSLFVSLATLIFALITFRHSAGTSYVAEIQKRIEYLEREIEILKQRADECERDRSRLIRENYKLMHRLLKLNGIDPQGDLA